MPPHACHSRGGRHGRCRSQRKQWPRSGRRDVRTQLRGRHGHRGDKEGPPPQACSGTSCAQAEALIDPVYSTCHPTTKTTRCRHALLIAASQHRYPFLLVDRVVEMDFQKSATGYKNVTMNDNFFTGHFPERAIMPGMCRACRPSVHSRCRSDARRSVAICDHHLLTSHVRTAQGSCRSKRWLSWRASACSTRKLRRRISSSSVALRTADGGNLWCRATRWCAAAA